jgi:hypothetical protein
MGDPRADHAFDSTGPGQAFQFMAKDRIFEMPWCALVAPDALFFTSDHPVFMHSVNNEPRTVEVSLALSARVRLVAHGKPRPQGEATSST